MSLLADGLLLRTQLSALTEAYNPSTLVDIATKPSRDDTPPIHSISFETGFGENVLTPEQPITIAPIVRDAPWRCAAVLWIKRTGVVLSWVVKPSWKKKTRVSALVTQEEWNQTSFILFWIKFIQKLSVCKGTKQIYYTRIKTKDGFSFAMLLARNLDHSKPRQKVKRKIKLSFPSSADSNWTKKGRSSTTARYCVLIFFVTQKFMVEGMSQ